MTAPLRLGVAVGLVALAGCASVGRSSTAPPPSRPALDAHLAAIRAHDLDAFVPTLTTRDSLVLVFPDGTLVRSREETVEIHRQWFADSTWTIAFEVLDVTEADGMAIATLRYTLTDDTPRSGRQALLSVAVAWEDNAWRLVHDQNTALP